MPSFKRSILSSEKTDETVDILQQNLSNLLDLALILKQAHWNVVGMNFRSVHLQLDEIVAFVRNATDAVAERIVTIGAAASGRAATIAETSQLELFADGFQDVETTVSAIADRMQETIKPLREAIEKLGDLDPVSEDLLISTSSELEKYLWMVQAQEVGQLVSN